MSTSDKQIIIYLTNNGVELRSMSLDFFQSGNTSNSIITAIATNSTLNGLRFYIASVGSATTGEIGFQGVLRIAK